MEKEVLNALCADETAVVLKADKGNTTVLFDQQDYWEKMEELLKDKVYGKIKKDPSGKAKHRLRTLLKATDWPKEIQTFKKPKLSRPPWMQPIVSTMGASTHDVLNIWQNY